MKAVVFGAGGAVGEAAVRALCGAGWNVVASMRQQHEDVRARLEALGAQIAFHDLSRDAQWVAEAAGADALIFATHLGIAAAGLQHGVIDGARLVVFSSNNVAADARAPSYRALAETEAVLRARFPAIAIIRPTLIYGDPRLRTITRLLRMAMRWPALPLPGAGNARVQPVFCDDLGVLAAGLAKADAPSGVFAAGGPDVVTMRELYRLAARAAHLERRAIISVPRFLLGGAVALGVLTKEQAARAGTDRVAIAQDPLPDDLQPRTPLAYGLAQHFNALSAGSRGGG